MAQVGSLIAKMHGLNIIHGDLTTSNIMIKTSTGDTALAIQDCAEIVLIDFGLSSIASQPEDKAVDLYVLERAFQATHPQLSGLVSAYHRNSWPLQFEDVLKAYSSSSGKKSSVIKRLEEGKELYLLIWTN